MWENVGGRPLAVERAGGSEPRVCPLTSPEVYNSGDAENLSSMSGNQVLHIHM
jgi:hypothetical protein